MATVHRMKGRGGGRTLLWLALLVLAIIAVHVWIDRLYQLRLHVALGYGGVYSKQMVFELLTRYGGAVVYAGLGFLAIRGLRSVLPGFLYPVLRTA
ncbi:MAG: hypothetical protein K6T30_09195, partial [Alicyclobacillus sp.]|nr:hypothetical protein [Alicyclobacillus sp.]